METEKEKDVAEMYVRFQKDLEFVQMLANPYYISCLFKRALHLSKIFLDLVQRNYFQDKAFLNYLKYLDYFRDVEYLKFIQYIVFPEVARDICDQQYFHWLDLGQVEKPQAQENAVAADGGGNPQDKDFQQIENIAQPQVNDQMQEEFS